MFHVMPIVRMQMGDADTLIGVYETTRDEVRESLSMLGPLTSQAHQLLQTSGHHPVYGPIPALQTVVNELGRDRDDLAWRVDFIRSTDAQPLGLSGQVSAFVPADLDAAFAATGLTQAQIETANEMLRTGVSFTHATQAAQSNDPNATLDALALADLNNQIDNWAGTDNDPMLDALIRERDERQRQSAANADAMAMFHQIEADSWSEPLTPLEEADASLDEIRDLLDTAKQDRGDGIGSADADGVWSTNDLEAMIENEHGYYTDEQVRAAQRVLTMANSSPEARDHLGITQSGNGWSFDTIGHITLDVLGMVPLVGNAADGINAAWYAAEGEWLDAALSSMALIPGIGQAVTLAKSSVKAALRHVPFGSLDEALVAVRQWLEARGILRATDDGLEAVDRARRGADGPTNVATHQQYLDDLRTVMDRPVVDDPNLNNIMADLWRPNAQIGNGSTAAAVRHELANPGARVGGRAHVEKAQNYVVGLENWLRNTPAASVSDRAAAQNVLRDLQNALGGR